MLWAAVASAAVYGGNFICSMLIGRELGPAATGQIAYITWLTATIGLLVSLGLNEALTRYTAELTASADDIQGISALVVRRLALLTIPGAGLTFALLPATYHENRNLVALSIALYLAQRQALLARSHLTGLQHFRRLSNWTVAGSLVQILVLAAACRRFGVPAALFTYLIANVLIALPATRTLAHLLVAKVSHSRTLQRRLNKYALTAWASAVISAFVWQRMEVFFLNLYCTTREVGLFAAAASVAAVVSQGPVMLTGALVPHFAEAFGKQQPAQIHSVYVSATKLLAFLLFPTCLLAAVLSRALVVTCYGWRFADAALPMSALVVAASFGGVSSASSALMHGMDRPGFIAVGGTVGAGLTIVTGLTAIPAWGVTGAAISKMIIQLAMVTLGIWYTTVHLGMRFPFRHTLSILMAAITSAAVVALFAQKATSTAQALALFVFGYILFLFLAKRLRLWTPSERCALSRLLDSRLPQYRFAVYSFSLIERVL